METDCFLCKPDPDLLIAQYDRLKLVSGLGPLTDTYVVIGAQDHVRCFADYVVEHPSCIKALEYLQNWFASTNGSVLLTEHGRVPMCVDASSEDSADRANGAGDHDSHCYHAHLLAFESAHDISGALSSYFLNGASFPDLAEALRYAATVDAYILSSPGPGEFNVYSSPIHMPRQLTRSLVAQTLGTPELGNWRAYPSYDQARATARRLRPLFEQAQLPQSRVDSRPADIEAGVGSSRGPQ